MTIHLAASYLSEHRLLTAALLVLSIVFPVVGLFIGIGVLALWAVWDANGMKSKGRWRKESVTDNRWASPKVIENIIKVRDGVRLKTHVIPAVNPKSRKCMLLACPLGQCGMSIYFPLVMEFNGK